MRKLLVLTGKKITSIIDFFYPLVKNRVSLQLFRYGATGGANVAFDLLLYFIFYNFVLKHQMLHLGFVTLSAHVAALAIVFPISFTTGFLLQKYVTFSASILRGKQQVIRYFMVVMLNLLLNYLGLKLFVDLLGFYPTPSKMIITAIATLVSYFSQKKFTFKISN